VALASSCDVSTSATAPFVRRLRECSKLSTTALIAGENGLSQTNNVASVQSSQFGHADRVLAPASPLPATFVGYPEG
jgi:hypothetical protein